MIFKDRQEAGKKLLLILKDDPDIQKSIAKRGKVIVVSLLRGGIVVGSEIASGLKVKHLTLVVAKIGAPDKPELAMGAVCYDVVYLEKSVINSLQLDKSLTIVQINVGKEKFKSYLKRFAIKKSLISARLKNKLVILVDDGIATGSTIKASILYLKSKKPKSIFLAIPVAPSDFKISGVDKKFILHVDRVFSAVSQFYSNFPQVEDKEVNKILRN